MASAQNEPIPELGTERVYTIGVRDDFGDLRKDIARIEQNSPQTYYVVIAKELGPHRGALRSYLNRLVETWKTQAARKKVPFDVQRSVVIVLDLENRRIIVLGGEELQEKFAFRDPYIERDLLAKHFYPYAKAGDYNRGLRVLVQQIDAWIAARDKEMSRQRESVAARESQLKGDATAAIAAGRGLLHSARQELDARKTSGLEVAELETTFRTAAGDIDAASERLATSASEALGLAQQGTRSLQAIMDQLRRQSAVQAELDARLVAATQKAGDALEAIETAGRAELPTQAVQARLDDSTAKIQKATAMVHSQPEQAVALVEEIERQLDDTLGYATQLPTLVAGVQGTLPKAAEVEGRASTEFERAKREGAVNRKLQADWMAARERMEAARALSGSDPRLSESELLESAKQMQAIQAQANAARNAHRFRTRTLPAMFLGGVLTVAAVLGAAMWVRRRRAQQALETQFKGFKEKAVELMDRLDQLRQKHKNLPKEDKDFVVPITGATEGVYRGVETDLHQLWDRWLRVMEAWEKAQALAKKGKGLGTEDFDAARSILEQEGNFEQIDGEVASCQARLKELQEGHENATASLEAAQREHARLTTSIQKIRDAGLPAEVLAKEGDAIAVLIQNGRKLRDADPIGVRDAATKSEQAAHTLGDRAARVLELLASRDDLGKKMESLSERTRTLRSTGFLLTEPTANPDGRLAEAAQSLERAGLALRRGNADEAAQHLELARKSVDRASMNLDSHLKARDSLVNELSAARLTAQQLEGSLGQAAVLTDELQHSFARSSWESIGSALPTARNHIQSIHELIRRAESAGRDDRQYYIEAGNALAQVANEKNRAERLIQAVGDKHKALVDARQSVRNSLSSLQRKAQETESWFQREIASIGPQAQESLATSRSILDEIVREGSESTPDWPALGVRAEAANRGLDLAMQEGKADLEARRKAESQLEELNRKARSVGAFLERENKDRPPANQRYRAAAQRLSAIERGLRSGPSDWTTVLSQLDTVAQDLDRSESLAKQDIGVANGAIAELAEASRVIRSAQAYYQEGITVDVSTARGRLSQGEAALAQQQYEQAIEHANAAENMARDAQSKASAEARHRRMRTNYGQTFDFSNIFAITAAQAAAEALSRWGGSGHSSGGGGGGFWSSGGDSGGGSWGSWGTDSDAGGWTGGADEGNW